MLRFSFQRNQQSLLTSGWTLKRRLILMNEQTVGAILENYDVAMLAGHIRYSDSLKEDYLHKLFESHSKVFQNSHFDFSSII